MLKRKTILLMVSAIALFGLVALIEGNRSVVSDRRGETADSSGSQRDPQRNDGERLFAFEEEDVETVEVQRQGETLAFEKREDGSWQMNEPEIAEAEGGAIAFLLSQIDSTSAHTLSVETSDLRDFGLQNPDATVVLTASNDTYTLTVGADDFTGDQLYVRADPPAEAADEPEQIKVHVVSGGMRNAVNRDTQDWLITDEDADASESESPDEAEESDELGTDDAAPDESR